MKIYLASPFFTEEERATKARIKEKLISMGHEVLDPQPEGGASMESWEKSNHEWASEVFTKDVIMIGDEADLVVAIDWGLYSDAGTAFEVGFAYANDVSSLVIAAKGTYDKPHSLMVACGSYGFITEDRFMNFTSDDFSRISHRYGFRARGIKLT